MLPILHTFLLKVRKRKKEKVSQKRGPKKKRTKLWIGGFLRMFTKAEKLIPVKVIFSFSFKSNIFCRGFEIVIVKRFHNRIRILKCKRFHTEIKKDTRRGRVVLKIFYFLISLDSYWFHSLR